MCGICGIISKKNIDSHLFNVMHKALTHRGPDDSGTWFSSDTKIAFGHKRLSIIDLSKGGHQPMVSDDGRFIIVYNGEIYNYLELKANLKKDGVIFKTKSDTEVLLKLWEKEGKTCLPKLRGMFAFIVWDSVLKQLFIARDPLGIKPLYFSITQDGITFASELKALKGGGMASKINPKAVGAFLKLGSIPAPLSLYEGIESLMPGESLLWEQNTGKVLKQTYWSYAQQFKNNRNTDFKNYKDAVSFVRKTLLDSVKAHLVSDVPVGAFLSGGIDSTAIVSLMRQAGQKKIHTFSIVFDDESLDESYYSRLAAKTYNTNHHEWRLNKKEFFELKKEFFESVDSPTIDGFNTWLVARFAHKNGVKVVTSGVGGDEFFYGYEGTFNHLPFVMKCFNLTPLMIKKIISKILKYPFIENRYPRQSNKATSLINASSNFTDFYLAYRGLFSKTELKELINDEKMRQEILSINIADYMPQIPKDITDKQKVSILEVSRYLGMQLLPDSDKFSMAHALELRTPFVDHVLAENLSKIDSKFFYNQKNAPKALLVDAVGDIPDEIVYRKKQGFTLPFGKWHKHDLWEVKSDFLNKATCKEINDSFLSNKIHWSRSWAIEILDRCLLKQR